MGSTSLIAILFLYPVGLFLISIKCATRRETVLSPDKNSPYCLVWYSNTKQSLAVGTSDDDVDPVIVEALAIHARHIFDRSGMDVHTWIYKWIYSGSLRLFTTSSVPIQPHFQTLTLILQSV
ncbi:Uncharacterized protein HZ326_29952, partial [Fusarium oxysporum f. sp. albedinis]